MLIKTLNRTIEVLDNLISLTKEDIKNIKEAKHEKVFSNTQQKEKLANEFYNLKNEIDIILSSRNVPIDKLFSKEEEELFNIFKTKLFEFNSLHKRFSKLALSVANFYNTLINKIHQGETVNYNEKFSSSHLQIKA